MAATQKCKMLNQWNKLHKIYKIRKRKYTCTCMYMYILYVDVHVPRHALQVVLFCTVVTSYV